jgi:hypothetical protein
VFPTKADSRRMAAIWRSRTFRPSSWMPSIAVVRRGPLMSSCVIRGGAIKYCDEVRAATSSMDLPDDLILKILMGMRKH